MEMISKRLLILLVGLLIINNYVFAQPIFAWSSNYGGSNLDKARDIEKTADGGYILAGVTDSDNGDVGGNNGEEDCWIVKLDNEGNLEWEGNYGGSDDDNASVIKQTSDDGFIVVGSSRSNDGGLGGNNGDLDSWIIKLDNGGNLEWSKTYGGSARDVAVDVVQTAGNGYAILSYSQSIDGDVGGNNGGRDYWIIKLDNEGNLEWEENYGGSSWDTPSSIAAVITGGYIISGSTASNDGDVSGNNGSNDSWLIKLDNEGNLEWEKNYGGSDNDVTYDFGQTIDGGFILAGRSNSNDGDVSGNNGEHDSWIIKLDSDGNLEWGKTYGGSANDAAASIRQTPSGDYIVVGDSESNDGDVGENKGDQDSWIMKLDNDGNLEWDKTYGGSGADLARDIVVIADDEFIVANWTESTDGDVIENNGDSDFWLIKFDPTTTSIQSPNINSKVTISPNPSTGQCIIKINDVKTPMTVSIFDVMGHRVYSKKEVHGSLSIVDLPTGNYYVQIVSGDSFISRKLIVL